LEGKPGFVSVALVADMDGKHDLMVLPPTEN